EVVLSPGKIAELHSEAKKNLTSATHHGAQETRDMLSGSADLSKYKKFNNKNDIDLKIFAAASDVVYDFPF
ncbi:unnamed protein product, partial [Amoebophrya sp. A25]